MIYRNVLSALIRALATDAPGKVSACWKDPAMVPSSGGGDGASNDDFIADCILHARMRRRLSELHYRVLTARYSPDFNRQLDAVAALLGWVKSPAPVRFRHAATATWALPKQQGSSLTDRKLSITTLPEAWYCMDNWSSSAHPIKTQERWRRQIRRDLDRLLDDALMEMEELIA